MPVLERRCFLCETEVLLASHSPGPWAIAAGEHGRVLCQTCIAERSIPIDSSDPFDPVIAWPDGDRFHRIGGQFVGAPSRNPASRHYAYGPK